MDKLMHGRTTLVIAHRLSTIKNADIALYEAKNKGRSTLFNYKDLRIEDTVDLF
jgi:ABC-type bacteriocin/lantibiotic exporter with double-glycine peptidase domain